MPAASAAAVLTITPPARAADASRAVVLTTSPSAVSSIVPPGPVPPTNASPVWTAVPTGIGPDGVASARAARSARSTAAARGRRSVVRAADPTKEERDDLVAHDLVDEAIVSNDCVGGQSVEVVEEGVELRRAQALSSAVESRTSENSSETGISTPLMPRLRRSVRHFLHRADCRASAPTPRIPGRGCRFPQMAPRTVCSVEGTGGVGTLAGGVSGRRSRRSGQSAPPRVSSPSFRPCAQSTPGSNSGRGLAPSVHAVPEGPDRSNPCRRKRHRFARRLHPSNG